MTPSIALAAPWPVAAEDAVAVAVRARSGVAVPTVMVTVAGLLLLVPLLTTSWNVKVPGLEGAVNVGCAAGAGGQRYPPYRRSGSTGRSATCRPDRCSQNRSA